MNIKDLYIQSYINGNLAKKEAAPYVGAVGKRVASLRSIFPKGTLHAITNQSPSLNFNTRKTLDDLKKLITRYRDIYHPSAKHTDMMKILKRRPDFRELFKELREKDLMYASELRGKGLPVTYNKITADITPEVFK